MQSRRWSSWLVLVALLYAPAVVLALEQQGHIQPGALHRRGARSPATPANIVARQPQATLPPLPRDDSAPRRRKPASPAPTPAHHKRILPGLGGGNNADQSSQEAASSSAAAAASSSSAAEAAASSSSALAASISSSLAAASSSSAAAAASSSSAAAAASSSREAAISSSRAAAASASAQSASLAAYSSSLQAALSSQFATTVTSTSTLAPSATGETQDGSAQGSNDGHTSLIIGVSVVGGAALLGLLAFLYMKFGQKRNHYDDDDADIKWPELRSDGDTAAMHPLPARRTGGAGFDMGGESDSGHDRDMVENDINGGARYGGRDSFSGSTTALGGGAAGYGAYGGAVAGAGAYHDHDGASKAAGSGYGAHAGYYDQYGQPAPSYSDVANPYADAHAAVSGYGVPQQQGYYDTSPSAAAPGGLHYGSQDMYGQQPAQAHHHAMASPPMQPTHTGYGGHM